MSELCAGNGVATPRPPRRWPAAWATIGILAAVFMRMGGAVAQDRPNVLLITIDTLRSDRLQAYGYSAGKTPVLTALANEGVLFENVIAQTPITLPSHATILSGTYPMYHGLQDVVGRMKPDVSTLADWLRAQGYQTAAFVGSSVLAADWGLNRGFDFYEDSFNFQGLRQIDFSRIERPAGTVVELASNWIRARHDKPFFVWVHLYDPHDPYRPPEPYATEFKDRPYDGEVAYVDAMLGRLFDSLKKEGLWEDCLIALTADHGESLGEHDEEHHAYFVYEASLRVPLILRVPALLSKGRFSKGLRIPNQVRLVDVAPTLLQLLGVPVPAQVQGEGLLAFLSGRRPGVELPAYSETLYPRIHFGWSPLFSYSNGSFKYIDAPVPELYDLRQDRGELHNIQAQNQAVANQLKEELRNLQRRYTASAQLGGAGGEADAETIERLKSLGYVAFSAGGGSTGESGLPDPKEKIATYNALNQAIAASREGKGRQALQMLQAIARLEPGMPLVHFLIGSEYFSSELYLKAAEEFERTIELNPESNVARFNLARSQYNSGLLDRAEETIRTILQSEPRNYGARHLLATILGRDRKFAEAADEERKALQLRPESADSFNNLGSYLLSSGRPGEALEAFRNATRLAPDSPLARLNLTLCLLKLERFQEARTEAARIVSAFPKLSLGQYYLGQALTGLGLDEEARAAFRRAKEMDPKLNVPIS